MILHVKLGVLPTFFSNFLYKIKDTFSQFITVNALCSQKFQLAHWAIIQYETLC
jgi:hypothetical protein